MYKRYSYRITLSPKRNRLHRYIGRFSVRVRVIKSDRLHRLRPILNHVTGICRSGARALGTIDRTKGRSVSTSFDGGGLPFVGKCCGNG